MSHHSQIPEKPLVASVNTDQKQLQTNRTYFFEREDGSIICTEEREAWGLYSRVPQVLGKRTYPLKFIGSSDGKKYQQAILESQQIYLETNNLAKAQERLRQGEKEELEIARGNLVPPRNQDKMGTGASYLQV